MDRLFYDLLGLVGFAHPLHPVLITMVVGPVIAAFLFAAVAFFFKKPDFFRTSRQLTVIAFIFWFPTVAVGILDWIHFYGGSLKMAEIPFKFLLAGILFVLLLGNILLFKWGANRPYVPLILLFLATVTVSALGYFGGNIVFGSEPSKTAGAPVASEAAAVKADGFKQIVQDGYTLNWKIHDNQIDVRVSYATNGWVGFGIGKTGTMEGSHIIIGYVLDGKAVVEDHFGYAHDKHAPEAKVGGKDSLTARAGTFVGDTTTLSFSMPLNTGNPKDPVLAVGETYKVLLANGGADAQDVETYHGRNGRIILDVTL
jgi:uncharacterized membrane protein